MALVEGSRRVSFEWPILLILSAIQFVHVMDFVIIMPLAPQLMRVLDLGANKFGLLVSVYNFSAALSGLAGAFFLDRYPRKKAMLFVFGGFILGTLACGLALGVKTLFIARIITGAFGGLVQALLFAIIGDAFSESKRGAATGTVMSAASITWVAGVPLGLTLAIYFGWRSTFLALAFLSGIIWLFAWSLLPKFKSHLRHLRKRRQGFLQDPELTRPFVTIRLLFRRNSLRAFALISALMFGGFTVIPFISVFLVANVGLFEGDLATVFLVGGVATLLTSRAVGKLSDRLGKLKVFTWLAGLSMVPTYLLTHLPQVTPLTAIVVTTLFTVAISARAIPALVLITSSVEKSVRGRFLSLTSAIQQASAGLASLFAGSLLGHGSAGEITHYGTVGNIAVIATFLAILAAHRLKPVS